ncbi:MAG: 2-C-methyl-D-erythritol 4-phosphate cytidylyltransferase [Anaerosomatales bacterium]|nr:2-C-methyl-D-erythritol 4-phosphate cytidylyltransferase [Anaerosomatales bacterium]
MNAAIIVAGGEGTRLGRDGGKQLAPVAGAPVLAHTVRAFEAASAIDVIIVVAHPLRLGEYEAAVAGVASKLQAVVGGGDSRQESVAAGLESLPAETRVVAIHDGARPLVRPAVIDEAIRVLLEDPSAAGVVVGHPSYDTVKSVDADGYVERTEDRDRLWAAQTPQVFRAGALRAAYAAAARDGFAGTDDASLIEHDGGRVRLVLGPRDNIKVTVPEDLVVVDRLLAARSREES